MVSGTGFQVVMSDLENMAGVFQRESATFEAIMPDNGPACPDGGSGDINAALHAAAQLLGVLHQQMAAVIDQHAAKLRALPGDHEGAMVDSDAERRGRAGPSSDFSRLSWLARPPRAVLRDR
jgi:Family of unknown function (DUF6317)